MRAPTAMHWIASRTPADSERTSSIAPTTANSAAVAVSVRS